MKRYYVALALILVLSQAITGCKETEPAPATDVNLEAKAGTDQDVQPSQQVTLNGSGSTGPDTKTFSWTIISKPELSKITLAQSSNVTVGFTPDIVGYYEMELTVSNGSGKSTDRVRVKAEYPTPIIIDADIASNTRLFDRIIDPAKPDYIVKKDISVKAELRIDQDVTMAFERDKTVSIEEKASISALGTKTQRIRFTGTEQTKGFWAGIKLYSPSTANVLTNVDITYSGSRIAFSNTKAALALFGNNKAQIRITDSKFDRNDGYGMYVQLGAVLHTFAGNSFSNHTESGILVDAYNATLLDAASKFTGGNGRDVVEISSSSIEGNAEVSWSAFADKTPYRLLGNVDVKAGWTLKAGVKVEVARDAAIRINTGGYLSAKGTADNKVTFGGSSAAAADWRGLIFYSTSGLNLLEQVDISGAGSSVMVSGQRSAVTAYGKGAKLTITKSRILNSGGYGIMYTSDAELNTDAGSANTFTGNAQANLFKL